MEKPPVTLPRKTRDLQWAMWDSARLDDFPFRDDDIMICSWAKTGTTWIQQLVGQLIFDGDPELFGQDVSPWIEMRALEADQWFEIAERQTHRRFLKTHSPLDALPFRPAVRYIYVARDPRDVVLSMYHHHSSITKQAYALLNHRPGRVGDMMAPHDCDPRTYYNSFMDRGRLPGLPFECGFWDHVRSFWEARALPNVLLVHFASLKSDFDAEARRIAAFLDIAPAEETWPDIIRHCGLDHMRTVAARSKQMDRFFAGGAGGLLNRGAGGRWQTILTEDEIAKAQRLAERELPPDCARWLMTGEAPA